MSQSREDTEKQCGCEGRNPTKHSIPPSTVLMGQSALPAGLAAKTDIPTDNPGLGSRSGWVGQTRLLEDLELDMRKRRESGNGPESTVQPDGPDTAFDDSASRASSTDPRTVAETSPNESTGQWTTGKWTADKERVIQMPYRYLLNRPGKDFRARLVAAFNIWLQVPAPSLKIVARVVGMLHEASLLIDDVEDSSVLRRGVPAAHQIYGTAQTINSANYVYFMALQQLCRLNRRDEVIDVFSAEMINLHRGQGMDLYWRDTLTCPSEDDYLEMVANKTGGLFRLAVRLMQVESRLNVDFSELVSVMGMLFQILDDYFNLCSTDYAARKGLCEDLTEGKFSFPIIHAIKTDPDLVVMSILRQRSDSDEVKQFAVDHMRQLGSFDYALDAMAEMKVRAHRLVDGLVVQLRQEAIRLQEEDERQAAGTSEGPTDDWIEAGEKAVRAMIDQMTPPEQ